MNNSNDRNRRLPRDRSDQAIGRGSPKPVYSNNRPRNSSIQVNSNPQNTQNTRQRYDPSRRAQPPSSTERHQNEQEAIRNLQRYLRQLSFFDTDIPTVPIDGIFDSATKEALTAFQRKYRLEPSGTANMETWNALYVAYLSSIDRNSPPLPLPLFPRNPRDYAILLGAESFLVMAVQYILNELAILNDGYETMPIEQTGVYDDKTENAVKRFQEQNGLRITGNTDMQTWNMMVRLFDKLSSEYRQ